MTISKQIEVGNLLAALNVRFNQDGFEQITIRDYLCKLLLTFWEEAECFSSKRPLGNSDWQDGIYSALILNGFIKGGVILK